MTATVKRKVVSSREPDTHPWNEGSIGGDATPNTSSRENLPPPPAPETKSKADTELVIAGLTQMYAGVGQAVFLFVDQVDGRTIVTNATELAESWRNLLDNDPKVRKVLKGMIKGGGWGTVITAHLAVAMPIVMNHQGSMEHLFSAKRSKTDDQSSETNPSSY